MLFNWLKVNEKPLGEVLDDYSVLKPVVPLAGTVDSRGKLFAPNERIEIRRLEEMFFILAVTSAKQNRYSRSIYTLLTREDLKAKHEDVINMVVAFVKSARHDLARFEPDGKLSHSDYRVFRLRTDSPLWKKRYERASGRLSCLATAQECTGPKTLWSCSVQRHATLTS